MPGGFHGVHAKRGDLSRKFRAMNYSERIEATQQDVVALQDQLASLPDPDDVQKVSDLTQRIGEANKKIFAWIEAEKALGSEASPITVPKDRITVYSPTQPLPASAPKAWAMPKRKEPEPGHFYLRHMVAKTLAFAQNKPIDLVLQEHYGSYGDYEATKGVHEWFQRAATAPATTGTAGWAAELAIDGQGEFINAIMAGSIFQPVASRGFSRDAWAQCLDQHADASGDADHCRLVRCRRRADPGAAGRVHHRQHRPQKDGGDHFLHEGNRRALDAADRANFAAVDHRRYGCRR